MQERINVTKI